MSIRHLTLVLLLSGVGLAACNKGDGQKAGADKTFTGKPYALAVESPPSGKIGMQLAASVRVVPRGPYKINLEYPHKLVWTGPQSAMPKAATMSSKQAAKLKKSELLFKPAFKVGSTGDHPFTGTLRFSVCTEKQCEIKSEKVRWVANVGH